jgi:4-amino-4-deoxy-L-arabinose transferase-like glycosyltransferase
MLMRLSEHRWLWAVLALYLLVGAAYAVVIPPWQSPDEPAHYNYVAHLAETGRLPVLQAGDYPAAYLEEIKAARFPAHMSIDPIRYEAWQPPLYYLLALPIFHLTGGALLPLRLFSLLLGAGVVITAYALARRVWAGVPGLPLTTAIVVAFIPMHLAMLASVNNDAMAELLTALIVWRVVVGIERPQRTTRFLLLTGVILGLGLLTKATVYYVGLPLAVISVMLSGGAWRSWWRQWLALLAPALLVALPWYGRNIAVYGWPDILGKFNHDQVVVGQLRTADYLAQMGWPAYIRDFLTTTFRSFWGQFGWMAVPMDRRAYFVVTLLSMLALVGLVLWWWEARGRRRSGETKGRLWLLLGLWVGLTAAGYAAYNVTFVQFQGRYLFPALIPLAILSVQGWRFALSRRGCLVALAAVVLVTGADQLLQGMAKWPLLIGFLVAAALLLGRRWLPQRWDRWLPLLPAGSILLLAVYSVPAFLIPYL